LLVTYGVASSFNQPEQNLIFNNNIVEFGPQNILNNMPNKVARTKGTEEFSKIFIQVRYQSQKISKIILKIDPNSPYAASLSKTQIQLYRQQDIVGNIPREQPVFISSFGPNLITNNRNELIINVNNETNKNCSNWEEYYCPFFITQN
jgi:hypothetical protein